MPARAPRGRRAAHRRLCPRWHLRRNRPQTTNAQLRGNRDVKDPTTKLSEKRAPGPDGFPGEFRKACQEETHASHAQGLSQRVQDGRELPPRATSAPTGEGRPAVRTTSSPGLGGAARLHSARCTRSCGHVRGTVRGRGAGGGLALTFFTSRQTWWPWMERLYREAQEPTRSTTATDRARVRACGPPVRGGCALPPAPSGPLPEKWW